MGVILAVRGARKNYGAQPALDGLDLEVRAGEWVALLGPNGAGKTTLLHAIAGVASLEGGTIETRGVGLVPQDLALYDALTVRENLEVFARFHGVRRREVPERVREALTWTGLEDRARSRAGELSGGMKRRLNVACGMLHDPAIVLLDEPTVGVDAASRARIREFLRARTALGAAVIHSTHEIDDVESSCDRVVVMFRGRVVAEGPPHALVERAFGGTRTILVELFEPCAGLELPPGFECAGSAIRGTLADVAVEASELFRRIARAGGRVRSAAVAPPALAEVIARLTGEGERT